MINPMEWIDVLLTLGAIIATATAVVIGNRVQQKADRDAVAREILSLRREIELLQMEAKEGRERMDNVMSLLLRNARQLEKE